MKSNILVISAGIVHPSLLARYYFRKLLQEQSEISFTFTSTVEELTSLNKTDFDSVVLYFHRSNISTNALDALDNFVSQGGGLLAVHSPSASFKQHDRYFDILGGRFVSHGKIGPFSVQPEESASEVFPGLKPFSVVDELYIHDYQDDVTIHCATDNLGSKEPVVWTKKHGKGKVSYCSLGHCAGVMKIPEVKQIIHQCLTWIQP